MIVVVASHVDDGARALVDGWPRDQATLLTPLDLSEPGWCVSVPPRCGSTAVASGKRVAEATITGIVTNLPCVFPAELAHINQDDRAYVAAEMTALLRCWLDLVPCRKLNRPTSGSLSGPNWSQERWLCLAAHAGLAVAPVCRIVPHTAAEPCADSSDAETTITVVGDMVIGGAEADAGGAARQLAAAADVELLTVGLRHANGSWRVVGARPFADLADPCVQSAVRKYFSH